MGSTLMPALAPACVGCPCCPSKGSSLLRRCLCWILAGTEAKSIDRKSLHCKAAPARLAKQIRFPPRNSTGSCTIEGGLEKDGIELSRGSDRGNL